MVIGIADFGLWIVDCPQAPGQEAEGPLWRRGSSRCARPDRKSTRLNSSHRCNSYAVFCLKKKNTNKIPKHLFQGYLNIYNNYFKAPWMPDRTEANPNELNQDDARYGFRCCHLKNICTAPLSTETELSRQMTTSTTSIDIMGLQAAYANLHTDQERDYFIFFLMIRRPPRSTLFPYTRSSD